MIYDFDTIYKNWRFFQEALLNMNQIIVIIMIDTLYFFLMFFVGKLTDFESFTGLESIQEFLRVLVTDKRFS